VGDRNISNISGEDKRQKQGEPENAEIQNSQLEPPRSDARFGIFTYRARS
jgi:hypothetical protein